ncbi:MAG: beta-lactamase family protein [Gammaproteobacteria bacterium]|nr:beta-lactamase family protein [Gammaproteobacteria bacterium]
MGIRGWLRSLLLVAATAACFSAWGEGWPAASAPGEVGFNGARLQALQARLEQYARDGKISGGVVMIARHGKVVMHHAFGERDREAHSQMTTDSVFRIASQTKAIISTGIMMLQEQGKLVIGDPVANYLPEFAQTTVAVKRDDGSYDVVKANRQITVHDLLTHSSGISYGSGIAADRWEAAGIQGWYFADRNEPIRETVRKMAALPFDAQPGEKWIYGYNIDILGAIIEVASGQPLDRFLRENILDPLGMNSTQFYLPREQRDRLAVVYSARDGKLERTADKGGMVSQGSYVDGPRKSFSGGAGLLSTAGDYARFLQMMLNGGELDGKRLLSANSVHLMTVDHMKGEATFIQPGVGFGLGFSVVTDLGARGIPGSLGEFAWGGAYHSTYWVDPVEDMLVVYLTQTLPAGDVDDFARLRAMLYGALTD